MNTENASTLNPRDTAEQLLAEIARLKESVFYIERDANEEISRAKLSADAEITPISKKIKGLEAQLEVVARTNKDWFAAKKTLRLKTGSVGFRKTTELALSALSATWADVLARIKEMGLLSAIRIKEDVDKKTLAKWNDAELGSVGVSKIEKENFWYEVI